MSTACPTKVDKIGRGQLQVPPGLGSGPRQQNDPLFRTYTLLTWTMVHGAFLNVTPALYCHRRAYYWVSLAWLCSAAVVESLVDPKTMSLLGSQLVAGDLPVQHPEHLGSPSTSTAHGSLNPRPKSLVLPAPGGLELLALSFFLHGKERDWRSKSSALLLRGVIEQSKCSG